jgi:AraC-like DNA-binding protein
MNPVGKIEDSRASALLGRASRSFAGRGSTSLENFPYAALHGSGRMEKPMATDALSNVLKTVRLTGAVFYEIAAQEPWAVASPRREMMLPKILPGADHLIAYHVVTQGHCVATPDGGDPIALKAGEVVVFTQGQPHVMSSRPGIRANPPSADLVDIAAAGRTPYCINLGEGPLSAKLVCGYLACDSRPFNPLIEYLPPVMTVKDLGEDGAGWTGQFIRFAVAEAAEDRAGRDSVLTKLSELMFIDVVRRHLENLPPEEAGWLAGLRDPFVGRALSLLHAKPTDSWTIEDLARRSGLSRSAMAERFTRLVGLPPMAYLARWRMQLASEFLLHGGANVASIAAEVGYSSEATFSRAFKNATGVAPSVWRRNRISV